MAGTFSYIRPDEMCSLTATVTTTVGATDSDYTDDWLVDGKNSRPAKATTGTVTWSCAFSSAEVGCIAICNHNIDAARTITIGGGISTTLSGPTARKNGINFNPFVLPTPASITGLTVGVASNSVAVVIGEAAFGKVRTIRAFQYTTKFAYSDFKNPQPGLSVTPFDPAKVSRTILGKQLYSTSELGDIIDWFEAGRSDTKPSLLIIDTSVQDAMLVRFDALDYVPAAPALWEVSMTFVEYPRVRW